jgi:hypothetical protein
MLEILGTVVIAAGFALLSLTVQFGSRLYTRDFWRPELGFGRGEIAAARILMQLIGRLLLIVMAITAVLGALYGLIWIIHAMWRAT